MIRILHTIDTKGSGGAETVFVNLVKALDREAFEPVVAINGSGWVCDELEKMGIKPLFVHSDGSFSTRYLTELVGIIRTYGIDIVQSHLLGSNLYCSLAGLICGVPVVSTFHGFVDMHEKERCAAVKSLIVNQGSARLVFVSDSLKEFYVEQKGFSAKKSVTIYNWIDATQFRPQRDTSIRDKLGLPLDTVLVGAVGNIRVAKGYEYLLEAARLVVDRHPQFCFVVAGEGSGRLFDDLMLLRNRLGLEKHFFFVGFEPDISRFMNNLDLFVLSSVSEGFSISTIEAMACGVPVIATRSGGPEEIIRHRENGVLVDACCPEKLAEGLIDVHDDALLKQKCIINGTEDTHTRYSADRAIARYGDVYRQLVETGTC